MNREEVSRLSVDELADFLLVRGEFEEGVIEKLKTNKIGGKQFLVLETDDLKDMFPVIGERISVHQLVKSLRVEPKLTHLEMPGTANSSVTVTSASPKLSGLARKQCPKESSWVLDFQVPTEYSHGTKRGILTGQLTKAARCEMVTALYTRVLQHTPTPSPYEYSAVCQLLVAKFPKLEDFNGTGYGSWKAQLKQRFRNGRRGSKPCSIDQENEDPQTQHEDGQPARKKARKVSTRIASDAPECDDKDVYAAGVEMLQMELSKNPPKKKRLRFLMKRTFPGRREWIMKDRPSVEEVLEVFPCLKKSYVLKQELRMIVERADGELLKDWPTWRKKILTYGKLEAPNRPSINSILAEYDAATGSEEFHDDDDSFYTLLLLSAILAGRSKMRLICSFPDTVDIEKQIKQIGNSAPYILRLQSTDTVQYLTVAESVVISKNLTLDEAVIDLFGLFFIFDIVYPGPLYGVLVFLQHNVLDLKDRQKVPDVVNRTLAALQHVIIEDSN